MNIIEKIKNHLSKRNRKEERIIGENTNIDSQVCNNSSYNNNSFYDSSQTGSSSGNNDGKKVRRKISKTVKALAMMLVFCCVGAFGIAKSTETAQASSFSTKVVSIGGYSFTLTGSYDVSVWRSGNTVYCKVHASVSAPNGAVQAMGGSVSSNHGSASGTFVGAGASTPKGGSGDMQFSWTDAGAGTVSGTIYAGFTSYLNSSQALSATFSVSYSANSIDKHSVVYNNNGGSYSEYTSGSNLIIKDGEYIIQNYYAKTQGQTQYIHLKDMNGTEVHTWNDTTNTNCRWIFERYKNTEYYYIINKGSAKALYANGSDAVAQANQAISNSYLWKLAKQSDGTVKIVNRNTGKSLYANYRNVGNGDTIAQYDTSGVGIDGEWLLLDQGSNGVETRTKAYNSTFYIKSNSPSRPGWNFKYWSSSKDFATTWDGKNYNIGNSTIDRAYARAIGNNKYEIMVHTNGNVSNVEVPIWTSDGNQSDLVWHSLGNGSWSRDGQSYNWGAQITHNGDVAGTNLTMHIYANSRSVGVAYGTLPQIFYSEGNYTHDQNGGTTTLYANWTPKSAKVTFHRNYNSSDTTTATQTYTSGKGQSFSANGWSRSGYTLLGWSHSSTATKAEYSPTNGIADAWIGEHESGTNLYAVWKQDNVTLTVDPNGGTWNGKTGSSSLSVPVGSKQELLVPTRDGYDFVGWKRSGSGSLHSGDATSWRNDAITMTEKADSDGTAYTKYTMNWSNTSTGYNWPSMGFFSYNYVSGHTYRVDMDIRVNSSSGLGYSHIRHSAFGNNWEATASIDLNSTTNGWVHRSMSRTFTGTTVTQNGTATTISPLLEFYCSIASGSTGSFNFDLKNITVYDETAGKYVSSTGGAKNGATLDVGTSNTTVTAVWKPIKYKVNYDTNGGAINSKVDNPSSYKIVDNGSYFIQSKSNENKYVHCENANPNSGAGLVIYDGKGEAAYQTRYTFERYGNTPYYFIVNELGGKLANIPGDGDYTTQGDWSLELYTQYDVSNADFQDFLWYLKGNADGSVQIINYKTNKAWTIPDMSNSTKLIQQLSTNASNQQFNLVNISKSNYPSRLIASDNETNVYANYATPVKTGYTFKGWKVDGTSTIYQPGEKITPLGKDMKLVAQWQANQYTQTIKARFENADGTFTDYSQAYQVKQDYDSTFTWDYPESKVYKATNVSYKVTGDKTTEVTVYRQTYTVKVLVRYQKNDGSWPSDYKEWIPTKEYKYGATCPSSGATLGGNYSPPKYDSFVVTEDKTMKFDLTLGKNIIRTKAILNGNKSILKNNYYTYDFYVNDKLIASNVSDVSSDDYKFYYTSTFTIKNIKPINGYHYEDKYLEYTVWNGYQKEVENSSKIIEGTLKYEGVQDFALYISPNTYTVNYNGNGATSGSTASSSHTYDTAKNLTTNGFVRTGYTFKGWNTKSDGTGTSYTDKQSVSNLTTTNGGTVTLYAQWTINSYNLTVNPNGGSWDGSTASQTFIQNYYSTKTIPVPTRTGYMFNRWDLSGTGSLSNRVTTDPYFQNSMGGVVTYNNNGDGKVTLTRQAKSSDNTYGNYEIKIDVTGANNPGYGGFRQGLQSAASKKYIHSFIAKLPVGTTLEPASNKVGDNSKRYWITPHVGTGKWELYAYEQDAGATGTFQDFGYVYVSKSNSSAFTWYLAASQITSIESSSIFTYGAGNSTLTAQWSNNIYNVAYNANGGAGTMTASQHQYDMAKNLNTNAFSRTGYTFKGWNTKADGTGTSYADKASVKNLSSTNGATVTLYAQWSVNSYTYNIKYVSSSGASLGTTTITGAYGSSQTVKAPDKAGYTTPDSQTVKFDSTTVKTITFTYPLINYTISYNVNGGNALSGQRTSYNIESTAYTLPTPTRTGYTFIGWTGSNGTTVQKNVSIAKGSIGNKSYTANWSVNNYTITYKANGGSGADQTQGVSYGTAWTSKAAIYTRTGYTQTSWNTKADGTGTKYSLNTQQTDKQLSNVTLYAIWTPYTLTINYHNDGGTYWRTYPEEQSKNVSSVDVVQTETIKYDASYSHYENGLLDVERLTKTGYHSTTQWKVGSKTSTNKVYDSDNLLADTKGQTLAKFLGVLSSFEKGNVTVDLYPDMSPNTYTVKYDGNGATSGSTASSSHTYDTAKALTANSFVRRGYTFKGWNTQADGKGTSYADKASVRNLTATNGATVTLYAQWGVNTYTVTYNANGGIGTMLPDTVSYNSPYKTKKSVFSRPGYVFNGWNEKADGTGTAWNLTSSGVYESGKTWTWTYTSNITLYAQWQKKTYSISYDVNGGNALASPKTSYDVTTATYTLPTPTRTGYSMTGWTETITTSYWNDGFVDYSTGALGTYSGYPNAVYSEPIYLKSGVKYTISGTNLGGIRWRAFKTDGTYIGSVSSENSYTPTENMYVRILLYEGCTEANRNAMKITSSNATSITQGSTGNRSYTANWSINTYTNSIAHWAWGFKNNEGNNSAKTAFALRTTTFSKKYGESYTLNKNDATTIPNGFYLSTSFSTSFIDGTWKSYSMPYTGTQKAQNGYFEYDYYPNTYKITYNLDGGTNSSDNPSTYNVLYGVTLKAPTKQGYTFAGWHDGNTKVTGINEGANATFASSDELYAKLATRTTGDKTLTAKWTTNTYTVKYDGNGATSGSTASSSHTYDTAKTLTANGFVRTGYTFKGWNTKADGTGTSYADKTSVKNLTSSNGTTVTLYAQWSINTYTNRINSWVLGFKNKEGNNDEKNAYLLKTTTFDKKYNESYTLNSDNTVKMPNGLYLDQKVWTSSIDGTYKSFAIPYTGNQLAKSLNFDYYFSPNEYKITYNLNGGTNNSANPSTYNVLYGVTLKAPTRQGYTFLGWYDEDTKVTGINEGANASFASSDDLYSKLASRTTGNKTLTAKWAVNTYTITYKSNGGTGSDQTQNVTYGTAWTSKGAIYTRDGYSQTSWNTKADGTGTKYSLNTAQTDKQLNDVTLYAIWTPYTLTINYHGDGAEYIRWADDNSKNENVKGKDITKTTIEKYGSAFSNGNVGLFDANRWCKTGYRAKVGYWKIGKNGTTEYSDSKGFAKAEDCAAYLGVLDQFKKGNVTVDLYPIWIANTLTVRYHSNGAFGGDIYESSTFVKNKILDKAQKADSTVNIEKWVQGNMVEDNYKNGLTNYSLRYPGQNHFYLYKNGYTGTGYYNTKADGTGTSVSQDKSFTSVVELANYLGKSIDSADNTVDLYPQWQANNYSIAYNGNGATSGTMSNQSATFDKNTTLTSNAYQRKYTVSFDANGGSVSTPSSVATATFKGWEEKESMTYLDKEYTSSDFSAAYYSQTYSDLNTAFGYNKYGLLQHYADYGKSEGRKTVSTNGTVYTYPNSAVVKNLTLNANGKVNLYAQWSLDSVTLPTPTRPGYRFKGWYTDAQSGDKAGNATQSYTPTKNITLYAHWEPDSYYIIYDKNDGKLTDKIPNEMTDNNGSDPGMDTASLDASFGLQSGTKYNTKYSFKGWNTKADGSGKSFTTSITNDGSLCAGGKTITLYAQWDTTPVISGKDFYLLENTTPASDVLTSGKGVDKSPVEKYPNYMKDVIYPIKGYTKNGTDITSQVKVDYVEFDGNAKATVDTSKPGKYTVHYSLSDGGMTKKYTRIITVLSASTPVINAGDRYFSKGSTITAEILLSTVGAGDKYDGDISSKVEVLNLDKLSFTYVGNYEVQFKVTNRSGKSVTKKVTIHVLKHLDDNKSDDGNKYRYVRRDCSQNNDYCMEYFSDDSKWLTDSDLNEQLIDSLSKDESDQAVKTYKFNKDDVKEKQKKK